MKEETNICGCCKHWVMFRAEMGQCKLIKGCIDKSAKDFWEKKCKRFELKPYKSKNLKPLKSSLSWLGVPFVLFGALCEFALIVIEGTIKNIERKYKK